MPTTNPFSLEYLVGGIQSITILFLTLFHFKSDFFKSLSLNPNLANGAIILLCFLSFAYPLGIIWDNLAAAIISRLFKEEEKHRANFNIILKSNEEFILKRAFDFQTSKRVIRITIVNVLVATIVLLIINIIEKTDLTFATGVSVFWLLVISVITYILITKNYQKYLSDLRKSSKK